MPAPALPEGARAGSLRAAPGSPTTARLGGGGASSRRGRARRRFRDLKLHRELQGQPRWRRRRPRRGLLLLPPPPSPPPPPPHHGGGPGGNQTSLSREDTPHFTRDHARSGVGEVEGKRSSPCHLDCASAFLGSNRPPPRHVTRETRSTVGGAVRKLRQAEGFDGKLPEH